MTPLRHTALSGVFKKSDGLVNVPTENEAPTETDTFQHYRYKYVRAAVTAHALQHQLSPV